MLALVIKLKSINLQTVCARNKIYIVLIFTAFILNVSYYDKCLIKYNNLLFYLVQYLLHA